METAAPPEGFREVYQDFTQLELGERFGKSPRQIRRYIAYLEQHHIEIPKSELPDLECPKLSGDYMIVGDAEIPYHDADTLNLVLLVAMRFGIKKLILNGDAFALEAFSSWLRDTVLQTTFGQDMEMGRQVFVKLLKYFDELVYTIGNHEARLARLTQGELSPVEIMQGLSPKLKINLFRYCEVGDWLIAHPDNYSKVPLSVSREIAEIKGKNVICAHTHHLGMCRDKSNRYWCVDGGCATRAEARGYKQTHIARYPEWNRGFVMLLRGQPYLIFTSGFDAEFWLEGHKGGKHAVRST